jgi:hypothetical protein
MAAFNKFNQFVEDLAKGVHNLDTDMLKFMLTNVAPTAANSVKADITEIAAGNGYSAGGVALIGQDAEQTGGTLALSGTDPVITAAGGSIGPFRYAVFYNDTPSSPADPLIGWWDYGSSITLNAPDSLTIDIPTNILTIA